MLASPSAPGNTFRSTIERPALTGIRSNAAKHACCDQRFVRLERRRGPATDSMSDSESGRETNERPAGEAPMTPLDSPVLLIGTHRSGTTFLGGVLGLHPDLAYWEEPRHVWTWGNSYRPDDRLTEADATPRIRRHIRRTFARFVKRSDGSRLCEKTPSNCLRLPFIRAIYPEARMIMILRDGRPVIRSTREILGKGVQGGRILSRALETPLWEWPAYVPRAIRTLRRRIRRDSLDFWGPRPPGWSDWVGQDPPHVVLARQWAETITCAVDDGRRMPPHLYREIRYEQLVQEPERVLGEIAEFAGLEQADEMIAHAAAQVDSSREERWRRELSEQTLAEVRPVMEPVLERLGYAW